MNPLISCLCPTFGRIPKWQHLVEETIESFLRQGYPNKELILCNDQPNQELVFNHSQVKVINHPTRFDTFAHKMDFMISQAQGEYLCRWDDDDISLAHRLDYSYGRLLKHPLSLNLEWRCENYIYAPKAGLAVVDYSHGNTHLTSLWHRSLLPVINDGFYPGQWAGGEDQMFNQLLVKAGYPAKGDTIPDKDIYYIYRWGVGLHWSGPGGDLQQVYDQRGLEPVKAGQYRLSPRWLSPYQDLPITAIRNTEPGKRPAHA